ncbi:MAG: PilZ domain-containing protein [Kofleriaceae bacterium]
MDIRPDRTFPRYALDAAVAFRTPGGIFGGRTLNLSRGGLCAEVTAELMLGLELELEIELVFDDNAHSEPLQLCGRVVWCTRVDDVHQLGLAFCHLQAEQVAFLSMFLQFLDRNQRDVECSCSSPQLHAPRSIDERFHY